MGDAIRPGETALFSGIYQVTHGQHHAETHYVTVSYGDVLPTCRQCLDQVRYELVMSAVHIKAHRHFTRNH